ncbi:MAG: hypothetical protein HON90_07140 [Halobacteriovoraceae bacterium]|jgi:hypothetical protein|nr:hypothetical protein [Halobacteriovoraceae bacterium]
MDKMKDTIIVEDHLMKAIGKSEVLIEEHKEAFEDLEESTEDLEGWVTIFFKAIKNALL